MENNKDSKELRQFLINLGQLDSDESRLQLVESSPYKTLENLRDAILLFVDHDTLLDRGDETSSGLLFASTSANGQQQRRSKRKTPPITVATDIDAIRESSSKRQKTSEESMFRRGLSMAYSMFAKFNLYNEEPTRADVSMEEESEVVEDEKAAEHQIRVQLVGSDKLWCFVDFLFALLPFDITDEQTDVRDVIPNAIDPTVDDIARQELPKNQYYLYSTVESPPPGNTNPFICVGYTLTGNNKIADDYRSLYGHLETLVVSELSSPTYTPTNSVPDDDDTPGGIVTLVSVTPWQLHRMSLVYGSDILTRHAVHGELFGTHKPTRTLTQQNLLTFGDLDDTGLKPWRTLQIDTNMLPLFSTTAPRTEPFTQGTRDFVTALSLGRPLPDDTAERQALATTTLRPFYVEPGRVSILESHYLKSNQLETEVACNVALALYASERLSHVDPNVANNTQALRQSAIKTINSNAYLSQLRDKIDATTSTWDAQYVKHIVSPIFTFNPSMREIYEFIAPNGTAKVRVGKLYTNPIVIRNQPKNLRLVQYFPQKSMTIDITEGTGRRLVNLNEETERTLPVPHGNDETQARWIINRITESFTCIEDLLFSDGSATSSTANLPTDITESRPKNDFVKTKAFVEHLRQAALKWAIVVDPVSEQELRSGIIRSTSLAPIHNNSDHHLIIGHKAASFLTTQNTIFKVYGVALIIEFGVLLELSHNPEWMNYFSTYLTSIYTIYQKDTFGRLGAWPTQFTTATMPDFFKSRVLNSAAATQQASTNNDEDVDMAESVEVLSRAVASLVPPAPLPLPPLPLPPSAPPPPPTPEAVRGEAGQMVVKLAAELNRTTTIKSQLHHLRQQEAYLAAHTKALDEYDARTEQDLRTELDKLTAEQQALKSRLITTTQ